MKEPNIERGLGFGVFGVWGLGIGPQSLGWAGGGSGGLQGVS